MIFRSLTATLVVLVGWGGLAAPRVAACQKEPPPRGERIAEQASRGEGWREGGARDPSRHRGHFWGSDLFRPQPEDEGPLEPGEQQRLENFLRQHAPLLHDSLKQLRTKDPAGFEQRLQDAAPQLRRLRRIYQRDPELGQNVIKHAENLQRVRRMRRAWCESEDKPEARRGIEDEMRRIVAENLQVEILVLEDRIKEFEQQRDQRIELEYERLIAKDADLSGESSEVRELVLSLNVAGSEAEIQQLGEQLKRKCAVRTERRLAGLRDRLERIRTNTVEEVDRRMKWMLETGERRDHGSGARDHKRRERP